MWTPRNTGVFLQRVETPETNKVIIKLVRGAATGLYTHFTTLILHLNNGSDDYTLEYDPWSDMNVTADNDIDEKDVDAITRLCLAFYRQPVIGSGNGVFLCPGPVDLVEIFDPSKPIRPIAPQRLVVRMEVLDLEDDEYPERDGLFTATSFDDGETFAVTRSNGQSPPSYGDTPELEELAKAFIKLKL